MKNHYTAEEAIRKLKIPRSTFYQLIKQGDLPEGTIIPLRKQAIYPRKDIDAIANERAKILGEFDQEIERFMFITPNLEELKQLVDVDRIVFHEETLISPEEQYKWLDYNSQAIHVLKDTKTKDVVGGVTISPLKDDALRKLIKLEMDETELKPDDFITFKENEQQDCYVIGIVSKPDIACRYYASRLIQALLDHLVEMLDKGIMIRYMYTVAGTEEGEELTKKLHFIKLPGEKEDKHEFRRPYVLDLQDKSNKSKVVQTYIRHKINMQRRVKRNQKISPLKEGEAIKE